MSTQDRELLAELVTESKEHLQSIEPDLLAMEKDQEQVKAEIVNRIFRAVHSIKGGFGFFGFKRITELAHAMENLLSQVRDGKLKPSGSVIDSLLIGIDRLRGMVEDIDGSEMMPIDGELAALKAASSNQANKPAKTVPDLVELRHGWQLPRDIFEHARLNAQHALVIRPRLAEELTAHGRTWETWLADLQEVGQVVSQRAVPDRSLDEERDLLVLTVLEPRLVSEHWGIPADRVDELPLSAPQMEPLTRTIRASQTAASAQIHQPDGKTPEPDPAPTTAGAALTPKTGPVVSTQMTVSRKSETRGLKAGDETRRVASATASSVTTLRIRVELLDHLMTMAGELVLARNQLKQAFARRLGQESHGVTGLRRFRQDFEAFQHRLVADLRNLWPESAGPFKTVDDRLTQACAQASEQFRRALDFPLTDLPTLATPALVLDRVVSELQASVMATRMQPASVVFSRFPRVVRDISRTLNKEIELLVEGGDVEFDKSIVEALVDPLTHLVRNSADHGIEGPEARARANKPRAGRVTLSARHESGQVIVEVRDDGGGIDPERVKRKAVERGMFTPIEADRLGRAEVLALIFAPGFSTANEVSDISGRGVGMDVVRSNIERLGGTVEVDSQVGLGTTVRMRMPLTLAIIPCLIVETEGRLFALPQLHIEEMVHLRAEEVAKRIETVRDRPVMRLRETILPLLRLNEALGIEATWVDDKGVRRKERRHRLADRRARDLATPAYEPAAKDKLKRGSDRRQPSKDLHLVVLRCGAHHYGLVVDHLRENEEIVVKPLPEYLKAAKVYSGVTILGDGNMAMILEPQGLTEVGGLRFGAELEKASEAMQRQSLENERRQIMLFGTGTGERFGLDLALVARIENLDPRRVEHIGDRRFLSGDGGMLRIFDLGDHLPVGKPTTTPATAYVIVPRLVKHPMGLIAYELHDIAEVTADPDRTAFTAPGVFGTLLIDNRPVILLDLYSLFTVVAPDLYQTTAPPKTIAGKHVLLAEDTPFFRAVTTDLLRKMGLEVTAVVDGAKAWDRLARGERYDLLITDVMMPNLDGCELVRRIRAEPHLAQMPILALTSLSAEADRQRLQAAGVDRYEVKIDSGRVSEAITALLIPVPEA